MGAPLAGCDHPTLGFDGARAQQSVPMIFACHQRERRRHRDDLGTAIRECSVQLRKTEVVTYGETNVPDGGGHVDDRFPGFDRVRLSNGEATRNLYVKQMDLPVVGDAFAPGTEHEARVVATGNIVVAFGVTASLRNGTDNEVDIEFVGQSGESLGQRTIQRLSQFDFMKLRAKKRGVFRRNHQFGTVPGGFPDQGFGFREVPIDIGGASKLNGRSQKVVGSIGAHDAFSMRVL